MDKFKNFQLIMVILFIFGGVLGVFVFAGFIKLDQSAVSSSPTGTVTLWGTVPTDTLRPVLTEINQNQSFKIKYVEKQSVTFEDDLLEAIVTGKAPDLFFLTDDSVFKYENKIKPIPYASYPVINFKNTFASASEVFLSPKGILALPITIDPLVMYYNRTMLDTNNVIYPPTSWSEFANLVKIFTKKNENKEITTSAFALGQSSNINHFKDIIISMFMQQGNDIVYLDNTLYRSSIKTDLGISDGLVEALDFYLGFSDPLKENYSWNKSLPNSIDAFSKEDLAFYFGFASDLKTLIDKNPNQNLAVANIPQYKDKEFKATRGKVTGIAISSFTKNFNASYAALNTLVNGPFAETYSKSRAIPPARRDLLAKQGADSYIPVFYSSALFAKSFIDPSKKDTDNIFRLMVEQVLSNGVEVKDSIENTSNRLNLLLFNR